MSAVLCHLCGRLAPGARAGDRCPADGRALVPSSEHAAHPDDPHLGRVISGCYPLLGVLRASSIGPTYRALKEPLGREVAVKLLRPPSASSAAEVAESPADRLRRLMPLVHGLASPALVKPVDYGVEPDGILFVVSELVEGTPLSDLLTDGKPIPSARAVAIVRELLGAIAPAHAQGIVHGNLKPSNVVLGPPGEDGKDPVRLLELGIAEVIQARDPRTGVPAGKIMATPAYISPEQVQRQAVGPRSDVYAAGAILYELLSGAPPFSGGSPAEVARSRLADPLPPLAPGLGLPPWLEAVVRKALAKDPESRFADAAEMARALAPPPDEKPARKAAEPRREPQVVVVSMTRAQAAPKPPVARQAPAPEAPAVPKEGAAAEAPIVKVPPAPAGDPPPPQRKTARYLAIAGAVLGLALAAAVPAVLSIRARPADGSFLDAIRPASGDGDESLEFPSIGPEAEAAAGSDTARRRPKRRAPVAAAADAAVGADAATAPERPDPADAGSAPAAAPGAPEKMLVGPARPDGSLLVSCAHRCKVYVDDGLVGESPKSPIPLAAGEHRLRAVNPDTGKVVEQTVVIRSEERTRVDLDL